MLALALTLVLAGCPSQWDDLPTADELPVDLSIIEAEDGTVTGRSDNGPMIVGGDGLSIGKSAKNLNMYDINDRGEPQG